MVNEKMLALGTKRSCIRELFEFGRRMKAEKGEDAVFDFSLGNPSVPAPKPQGTSATPSTYSLRSTSRTTARTTASTAASTATTRSAA